MKFEEALKSGLAFKRKPWGTWWSPGTPHFFISREDILAQDWEVGQKPTVQIGIEQFNDAASKAQSSVNWEFEKFGRNNRYEELIRILKQELDIP